MRRDDSICDIINVQISKNKKQVLVEYSHNDQHMVQIYGTPAGGTHKKDFPVDDKLRLVGKSFDSIKTLHDAVMADYYRLETIKKPFEGTLTRTGILDKSGLVSAAVLTRHGLCLVTEKANVHMPVSGFDELDQVTQQRIAESTQDAFNGVASGQSVQEASKPLVDIAKNAEPAQRSVLMRVITFIIDKLKEFGKFLGISKSADEALNKMHETPETPENRVQPGGVG